MTTNWPAVLVTIGFSLVGVAGDYFLKLASQAASPLRTPWFAVGFAVYASTAFGWVFVMKHLKLATRWRRVLAVDDRLPDDDRRRVLR